MPLPRSVIVQIRASWLGAIGARPALSIRRETSWGDGNQLGRRKVLAAGTGDCASPAKSDAVAIAAALLLVRAESAGADGGTDGNSDDDPPPLASYRRQHYTEQNPEDQPHNQRVGSGFAASGSLSHCPKVAVPQVAVSRSEYCARERGRLLVQTCTDARATACVTRGRLCGIPYARCAAYATLGAWIEPTWNKPCGFPPALTGRQPTDRY